jgi:hypothetical protein
MAEIIPLPTAAAAPVINSRYRGRYPRNVVSQWKLVATRSRRGAKKEEASPARPPSTSFMKIIEAIQGIDRDDRVRLLGVLESLRAFY